MKHTKYNNQFKSVSVNIALNAEGYNSDCGKFYKSLTTEIYNYGTNHYRYPNNYIYGIEILYSPTGYSHSITAHIGMCHQNGSHLYIAGTRKWSDGYGNAEVIWYAIKKADVVN